MKAGVDQALTSDVLVAGVPRKRNAHASEDPGRDIAMTSFK